MFFIGFCYFAVWGVCTSSTRKCVWGPCVHMKSCLEVSPLLFMGFFFWPSLCVLTGNSPVCSGLVSRPVLALRCGGVERPLRVCGGKLREELRWWLLMDAPNTSLRHYNHLQLFSFLTDMSCHAVFTKPLLSQGTYFTLESPHSKRPNKNNTKSIDCGYSHIQGSSFRGKNESDSLFFVPKAQSGAFLVLRSHVFVF